MLANRGILIAKLMGKQTLKILREISKIKKLNKLG